MRLNKKIRIKKNGIMILTVLIIECILGMYSVYIANLFAEKTYTTYHLEKENYTYEYIAPNHSLNFNVHINYDNIEKILINTDFTLVTNGNIRYNIYGNEKKVSAGSVELSDIQEKGGIEIVLNDIQEENIKIEIESFMDNELGVRVAADNFADVTETYSINLKKIIWIIVLFLQLLVLVMSIFLTSNIKIENKFLLMALLLGVFVCFSVIPCNAPDEWRHFARAYDAAEKGISETTTEIFGGQNVVACEMPKEYLAVKTVGKNKSVQWNDEINWNICIPKWRALWNDKNISEEKMVAPLLGTESKIWLEYLPQIVFIMMAKKMNLNAVSVFYMARLGNVLAAIFLAYIAIKIVPNYKMTFIALFFIPGITWLRGSCSTDGFLYSLILLLISIILYLKEEKKNIFTWKSFFLFSILGTYIAIIKLPYIMFISLIILVDYVPEKFNKKPVLTKSIYILAVFIFCMLIRFLAYKLLLPPEYIPATSTLKESITYLLANPIQELSVLTRYYVDTFCELLSSAVAWPLQGTYGYMYLFIMIFICINDDKMKMNMKERAFLVIFGLTMWAIIVFVGYALMSVPKSGSITGIQGRYMTPFIVLFLLGLVKGEKRNCNKGVQLITVFGCNILFIINYIGMYWIP